MLNILVLVVGKFKEDYWESAEKEYLKRLKPYAKIEIKELLEEKFSDISEKEKTQKNEAEKILKNLPDNAFVIACDETGKSFNSVDLAKIFDEKSSTGQKLCLIIGGSTGLHESVKNIAHVKLSLSSLTFPHQLARVILLEQIYRASTIINGKQYHY